MRQFRTARCRVLACVLAGLVMLGCLPSAGATKTTTSRAAGEAAEAYLRAIARLNQGDFDRGIMEYYAFLLRGEDLVSVAVRRADLGSAHRSLLERLRQPSREKRTMLFVPLIERMLERCPEALKQIDLLLARAPKSAVLNFLKGEFLLESQMIGQAREQFRKLEEMPNNARFVKIAQHLVTRQGLGPQRDPETRRRFLIGAGFRQWDLMARDRARMFFETAIKEFPDDPQPARALVDLFLEERRPLEAEKIVTAWKAAHDQPLLELQQAGRLAVALGRHADAIPALEALAKASPDDLYIRFQLAEACYQCERYPEALEQFKRLFECDSNNVGFVQRYAECLVATGRCEAALELFTELASARPEVAYYRIEAAALHLRLGEFEEAKRVLKTLAADPAVPQGGVHELMETAEAGLAAETERRRKDDVESARRAAEAVSGGGPAAEHPSDDAVPSVPACREGAISLDEARRLAQMYE